VDKWYQERKAQKLLEAEAEKEQEEYDSQEDYEDEQFEDDEDGYYSPYQSEGDESGSAELTYEDYQGETSVDYISEEDEQLSYEDEETQGELPSGGEVHHGEHDSSLENVSLQHSAALAISQSRQFYSQQIRQARARPIR
jgi:hypothetical protein